MNNVNIIEYLSIDQYFLIVCIQEVKLAEFKTAIMGTSFPLISHRTLKQEDAKFNLV